MDYLKRGGKIQVLFRLCEVLLIDTQIGKLPNTQINKNYKPPQVTILRPGSHTKQKSYCLGISCQVFTVIRPLYCLLFSVCLTHSVLQLGCVSPNVSPRLFVRALIPCTDDIMVRARPISFRDSKLFRQQSCIILRLQP